MSRTKSVPPTRAVLVVAWEQRHRWEAQISRLRSQAEIIWHRTVAGGSPLGKPAVISPSFAIGMSCLLVWPLFLACNCLVLAQIMELFVPRGHAPVVIPLVGLEMDSTAVALALIVALCQAVFVLFFGATRGWIKALAAVQVLTAVAFETGGAYLRSRVLHGAGLNEGGILSGQTAAVSAVIAFTAPVGLMTASEMAVTKVIAPLIELPGIAVQMIALRFSIRRSLYRCPEPKADVDHPDDQL